MMGPSIDMTQQAEFKNNTGVGVISSAETAGSARFPGKPEALFKQPQDLEEGHMAARVNREASHAAGRLRGEEMQMHNQQSHLCVHVYTACVND